MANDYIGEALNAAEAVARSLRQTAGQARAVEEAGKRIATTGRDTAAAGEQMRGAVESVAASIEHTGISLQHLVRSQQQVNDEAGETLRGLEITSSGAQELSALVVNIKKDTDGLAASAERTAATLEERARSI